MLLTAYHSIIIGTINVVHCVTLHHRRVQLCKGWVDGKGGGDDTRPGILKDGKIDHELAFWIPKYITTRGTKNLLDTGLMSPQMRRLARSQDTIGWRDLTERAS